MAILGLPCQLCGVKDVGSSRGSHVSDHVSFFKRHLANDYDVFSYYQAIQ
jgi:hypothetical protein